MSFEQRIIAINHFVSLITSSESTFDALRDNIAEKWFLRDDTVKPFGVSLENLRYVCTFDLGQDLFTYSDVGGDIQLPLARLRNPVLNHPSDLDSLPSKTHLLPR